MSISDQLTDTITGEQKRWASMMGLNQPLPEPAKNGNLWGVLALGLGLAVMAGAFVLGPVFIKVLVVVGLVVMAWRVEWLKHTGAQWTN